MSSATSPKRARLALGESSGSATPLPDRALAIPTDPKNPNLDQTLALLGLDHRSEFLRDPEILKLVSYAHGLGAFAGNYAHIQKYMDDGIGGKPLQPIGGVALSADVKHLNVRQLAEQLNGHMTQAGRDFCRSFSMVQSVVRGEYWSRLRLLFDVQAIGEGTPKALTLEEICDVLPVVEIAKASIGMQKGVAELTRTGDLFLNNVNRHMCVGGKAEDLHKTIVAEQQELDKEEKQLSQGRWKTAAARGELESAIAIRKAYEDASSRKASTVDFWEQERKKAAARLESYKKQEHDYNYRCYGPFKWVWENDVALARKNVERTEAELKRFNEEIQKAKQQQDSTSHESAQRKVVGNVVKAQEELKVYESNEAALQRNVNKRKTKINRHVQHLEYILAKEKKTSVQQLLDASDALQELAGCGQEGGNRHDVFTAGWQKDLNFLAMILNKMARQCKTLKEQKSVLDKVMSWAGDEKNVFIKFMKSTNPLQTIKAIAPVSSAPRERSATMLLDGDADVMTAQMLKELEPEPVKEINFDSDEHKALVDRRVAATLETATATGALPPIEPIAGGPRAGIASSDAVGFVDELADEFS